jgi:hypothetical protein
MDSKALSVLSMQTLQEVGKGESSKIFFPMEVTKLVEGISEYVGSTRSVPDREVSDVESIKEAVGNPDDILGPIPTIEEIKSETEKLDKMMKDDMDDVADIISKEPKI